MNALKLECDATKGDFLEVVCYSSDKSLGFHVTEGEQFSSIELSDRSKVELLHDVLNLWLKATEGE